MLKQGYKAGVLWRAFEQDSLLPAFLLVYLTSFYDSGLSCPYTVSLSTAMHLSKYGDAAHVVAGRCVTSGEASRDIILVASGGALLERDKMFPRVAEVVFVDDLFTRGREDAADQFLVGAAVAILLAGKERVGRQDMISPGVAQGRARYLSTGWHEEVVEV